MNVSGEQPGGQTTPVAITAWLAVRRRNMVLLGMILACAAVAVGALCGWRVWAESTAHQPWQGVVTAIVDAVTLEIQTDTPTTGTHRLRLLGVTCPADWQPTTRAWLTAHLLGRRVIVRFDPAASADMGVVYRDDGLMINESLIDGGLGQADSQSRHELAVWFARLDGWARKDGRGQWKTGQTADE
jgi:hypothetical protein